MARGGGWSAGGLPAHGGRDGGRVHEDASGVPVQAAADKKRRAKSGKASPITIPTSVDGQQG